MRLTKLMQISAVWLLLSPFAQAQDAVASDDERIVRLMSEAIRYQTISYGDRSQRDFSHFTAFRGFLKQSFPTVFSSLEVTPIAEHSLLLKWQGKDSDLLPVLFDAHYDVVPIESGTESEWQQPPFEGVVADGFIWGRGALDDKASVVSTLEALERLLKAQYQPTRTLYFSFVHDEEIGGQEGARNVASHLQKEVGKLAYVIGEGGMLLTGNPMLPDSKLANVSLAEKTYATATLTARGPGGHSSMPVDDNAIVRLAKAVQTIHENPFEPELVAPVTNMLETLGQEVPGIAGWLMRNHGIGGPLIARQLTQDRVTNAMVRSTTAVTMFDAGVKENVISQQSEAKVNFRLLPGYSVEQLQQRLEKLVDDPQVTIKINSWPSMPVADFRGEGYKAITAAVHRVQPETLVTPTLLTATTDRPKYQGLTKNLYGFHTHTMPLGDASTIHNTNERVGVASIIEAVSVSESLIQEAGK
ncbi:M20 family peptidase [Maricurvus nonylphenolicus]|uniref:M20/M25/M40 family metallo-hydrolase n=1 Tax=Maricurvus nonylphenolicus TaxID=1008307 RepID=UPI0036F418BC